MKITLNITGDVDIEINVSAQQPKTEPAEQQQQQEERETQLDALVIPADDSSEPKELDARKRPDSYGFTDKRSIGFSVSRHPAAEAALSQ